MERAIALERGRGVVARLKLILTPAGVCVRTQEMRRGDRLRWVYTSKAFPLPEIPDEDEADVRAGPILIRCKGVQADVYLGGRELGRCSVLSLAMHVEEMERHRRRMEEPLPDPDRPHGDDRSSKR